MEIYGITGQTGAGKSTVLRYLQEKNAYVIDCDKVYWEILETSRTLQEKLTQTFGDISQEQGGIDRKKLGAVVFSSTDALEQLNHITHPYVLAKVEENILEAQAEGKSLLAIDAISLIESGLHHRCDYVFAVIAREDTRIARIQKRDQISADYARQRVQAQKNEQFFRDNANAVIENDFDNIGDFSQYLKDFFIKYK